MRALCGIYAILDTGSARSPLAVARDALSAGVRLLQYRAKDGVDRALVRDVLALTRAHGALLIVNDDLETALEADGLHVGQEDLKRLGSERIRAALGTKILGISCATPAEARDARELGADYLGVGPYNATATKADAGAAIGAAGVRTVVAASTLPVAAIGGIELADLAAVAGAGAKMAAVISALVREPDPAANARALVARWNEVTR